ncbi:MAG: hypothetical protein F9K18_03675 [Thermoanaerobaculia bacterium]|nr:MAG: hypothetical protein F9K18_03675 [Thermoanaerobaculia bacterium]
MTRLPRDVVRDLWLLVESGEASADSRALVEAQLAADPELARELAAAGASPARLPATPPPPSDLERKALALTRRRLSMRTQVFAVALFFTLLPLSFVVKDSRITFLLVRDAPLVAGIWWAVAAVLWAIYFVLRRRISVPGL